MPKTKHTFARPYRISNMLMFLKCKKKEAARTLASQVKRRIGPVVKRRKSWNLLISRDSKSHRFLLTGKLFLQV